VKTYLAQNTLVKKSGSQWFSSTCTGQTAVYSRLVLKSMLNYTVLWMQTGLYCTLSLI